MPRVGAALDPEDGAAVANATLLHGEDGLGNARWAPTSRQHVMTADKLISEQLRAHPGEITLVCTGPLSGIAKLATRDPAALALIDRMIIAGGSTTANGNGPPWPNSICISIRCPLRRFCIHRPPSR